MEIKQIRNIEAELKRFTERLKQCKQRVEKDGYKYDNGNIRLACSRESGALKRAALDFKQVLTKELKNEY